MTDNITNDRKMQEQAYKALDAVYSGKPAPENFEEQVAENPYLKFVVAADTARDAMAEIGRTITDPEAVAKQALCTLGYTQDLNHMAKVIVRATLATGGTGVDRSTIDGCNLFADASREEQLSDEDQAVADAIDTLIAYLTGEEK